MKKTRSAYRWMVLLMISSQLLLSGFVAYWLISQYKEEKLQLHTNLKHEYLSTYSLLIDSMLMRDLIVPTLKDSMVLRMDVSEKSHVGSMEDSCETEVLVKHFHMDSLKEKQVFALQLSDGHTSRSLHMDTMKFHETMGENLLVRSVKLFIDQADESFRADPKAHVFSMKVDSLDFRLQLENKVESLGWDITLDPINITSDSLIVRNNGLVLRSFPSQAVPQFLVSQYKGYILKQMIPQFLFVLVLLSISASALWIVYRNLKRQMTLNKMRNDFIANISHELQTPVSTVKVALEALGTYDFKKDPTLTKEYLEMASREVDRLGGLVGKVLNQTLLDDHSDWMQKEICDLHVLILKVIRTLEISIRNKDASVSLDPVSGEFHVLADPVYVEGVISNLIDNSMKYAGESPEINIKLTSGSDGIFVSVRDNGPGIPKEYQQEIFEKFFRITSGNRHEVKGYGLGLNFCLQVMQQHGGSISQRNISGGGCEIILHFPATLESL